jgi:hypothetical protein
VHTGTQTEPLQISDHGLDGEYFPGDWLFHIGFFLISAILLNDVPEKRAIEQV